MKVIHIVIQFDMGFLLLIHTFTTVFFKACEKK